MRGEKLWLMLSGLRARNVNVNSFKSSVYHQSQCPALEACELKMSDVIPALSPMPILKMEGGGVVPMNQTSVIPQPVCFTQNSMICSPSIITSHPPQHLHLLHPQESSSPIHAVPSLVNDDIAEVENSHSPEVQCNSNQVHCIALSIRTSCYHRPL